MDCNDIGRINWQVELVEILSSARSSQRDVQCSQVGSTWLLLIEERYSAVVIKGYEAVVIKGYKAAFGLKKAVFTGTY